MIVIHVKILNEDVDVRRPVSAERLTATRIRIDPAAIVPDDETWEFGPGQVVECIQRNSSNGVCLVAVRAVDQTAADD